MISYKAENAVAKITASKQEHERVNAFIHLRGLSKDNHMQLLDMRKLMLADS
jgi:hypothetical protein